MIETGVSASTSQDLHSISIYLSFTLTLNFESCISTWGVARKVPGKEQRLAAGSALLKFMKDIENTSLATVLHSIDLRNLSKSDNLRTTWLYCMHSQVSDAPTEGA